MTGAVIEDPAAFVAALAPRGALMGLDLGEKTIGVAVSDTWRRIATPLETVRRVKFGVDAAALLALTGPRDIKGIVLGLPRNMDGSEGPRCQSTRAFARNLSRLTDIPITFQDERLVDRRGGTGAAGGGHVASAAGRGDRPRRGRLYPSGTAGQDGAYGGAGG